MTVLSDTSRTVDAGRLWTGGVANLGEKVATAAIYLAIGISIGSPLSGVTRSAMRGRL